MIKLDMKLVRPFGPSILHTKIPVNTVEMLNKYIDDIVADKKKSSALDHGCLLYTSPSPRDLYRSRMPSSA